ncbi:DUF2637 domain-containing protein [Actinotalea caeni]|uniref:DUF2637 domain-containing protein n=1 Tax=Actinotalea caeni TaxID=1348467 RepID=UPI0012E2872B|nr:DUF2637 domain-containing protein [Actinotalea caeni]
MKGQSRRWAVATSTGGTVGIAGFAFWLSFIALTDLARRSGVAEGQAWAWPLIVDGLIVVATVAAFALDGHRSAWYPWLLLMAATGVSVAGNVMHATVTADAGVPALLAGCVAAVPPLMLLASTHLTVVLIRSTRPPEPETVHEPAALGATAVPSLPSPSEGSGEPDVGDRRMLAAELRGLGWSNKRIARELDVHPSTVGRWLPRADHAETSGAHQTDETDLSGSELVMEGAAR